MLGLLLLWLGTAHAHETRPFISIIIDDLGNRQDEGVRTVALPGAVTLAFLPHTPHARALALQGHEAGKEIMLHLPMEATEGNALGPGGIKAGMDRDTMRTTFVTALESVPHARGVNNHMGSLLTAHVQHMEWFMAELATRGELYFVDSRTTTQTVAQRAALAHELPATRRDVFLDTIPDDEAYVEEQWDRLLALARQRGHALAIGHPYAATLSVLERRLAEMPETGVELVSVSEYLKRKKEANRLWQASSSHSQTAARNSKPSP
ncbi:divergent polysaccharide deacetylase family protein [Thioalkalivibrio denitrificans]|nr:divergent polysaccharide deacetylase family protein [Thioalkalivibrio denitrificans]